MPAASFTAEGDSIETKMSDSVITTKVKAAFAKSKEEAARAVKLTKGIKGVTEMQDDIIAP